MSWTNEGDFNGTILSRKSITYLDMENTDSMALLVVRLLELAILVALLAVHVRSLRVFRWEQSVSGGVIVTYGIAVLGLVLCAVRPHPGGKTLQYYVCLSGALLLTVNAIVIMRRWKTAGEMTRVVCELLGSLGLQVKIQIMQKVVLSVLAAIALLTDLGLMFFKLQ